jgi:hypothetical protein
MGDQMNDKPKPKTLYKFRSWANDPNSPKENLHRTLLTERQLWVPTATDLNDPFDCCIPLSFHLMPKIDLVERFESMLPDELSPAAMKQKALDKIQEWGFCDEARKEGASISLTQQLRGLYGILSFSTVIDDPLLWSHYADAYRGFCVGINMDQFLKIRKEYIICAENPFLGAWVKYVDCPPTIVPSVDKYGDLSGFLKSFTTKSLHWDYEREYRYVFARRPEFGLFLTPQCVSEVILGSEMPEAHKKEITKVVAKQFPSAQLLQARRKFDSFELEFIPV